MLDYSQPSPKLHHTDPNMTMDATYGIDDWLTHVRSKVVRMDYPIGVSARVLGYVTLEAAFETSIPTSEYTLRVIVDSARLKSNLHTSSFVIWPAEAVQMSPMELE
jgi:hypothetical protein